MSAPRIAPSSPDRGLLWVLLVVAVGSYPIAWVGFAAVAIWDGPSWLVRIGAFGTLPPAFWLLQQGWRFLVHPDRCPEPWPCKSRFEACIKNLILALACLGLSLNFARIFFTDSRRHPVASPLLHALMFATQAWFCALLVYYYERRYVPPPPEPPAPWSTRFKPLRSDHWGQPKSPNPGAAQP